MGADPETARRRVHWRTLAVGVAMGAVLAVGFGAVITSVSATPERPGEDPSATPTTTSQAAAPEESARNVILLIGDGMGDSEITIARNYLYGAAGQLPGIDALPMTGQYTTYSLYRDGHRFAGKPDYTPDSAATATAWATGSKTYDHAISVDIHGTPLPTLLELAKADGLRTGDVTTAAVQDATPAALVAHVANRRCYGPDSVTDCGRDALVKGGLGSISEQLLDTRPDVTLGGGASSFRQKARAGEWKGKTLLAQAASRGYQVVTDAAGLAAVTVADQDQPLLGLFASGTLPTRWKSRPATIGGSGATTGARCSKNPDALPAGLTLADLTTKAISLLDSPTAEKGFFLQVEGASIDKRNHKADACGQIGETDSFDKAVQAALAFAESDGNTLVIVTADHGHSSQIVDGKTPGLGTVLTTADGTPLRISYGTAGKGGTQQHTGTQVRIAAFGPGAERVLGLTDQTDTFVTISELLGLGG